MCFSQTSLLLPPSAECVRCDALSGEQVSAQSQPALRSREQIDARSLARSHPRIKPSIVAGGRLQSPPPPLRDAAESRRLPGGFSQRDLTQPRSLCAGRDLLLSSLVDFLRRTRPAASPVSIAAPRRASGDRIQTLAVLFRLGSLGTTLIRQVYPGPRYVHVDPRRSRLFPHRRSSLTEQSPLTQQQIFRFTGRCSVLERTCCSPLLPELFGLS